MNACVDMGVQHRHQGTADGQHMHLAGKIPRTKDMVYFPWLQQFLELGREILCSVWDV
jgi:hypothetical protein